MADLNERFSSLFGFDPAKSSNGSESVLASALKEINEERDKAKKAKVKEQMLKAIDLKQQMEAKKKEFQSHTAKFEKELGKIMNQLEAMAKGQAVVEESSDEAEKPAPAAS